MSSRKAWRSGRWLRLSMREMLFAFVALAAVLAMVVNARSFAPSAFFNAFNHRKAIEQVCGELGLSAHSVANGSSFSRSKDIAVRHAQLTLESPPPSASGRIMAELQRNVEALLEADGCTIDRRGRTEEPLSGDVVDFNFDYHSGATRGDMYVWSSSGGGATWHVHVLIHEF